MNLNLSKTFKLLPQSPINSVILTFIGLAVVVSSCADATKENRNQPSALEAKPQIIELNLDSGYSVNKVNGLPINYIIDKHSDTLETGKAFLVQGSVENPDSLEMPFDHKTGLIKNGEPVVLPEFSIIKQNATIKEVIQVDESALVHFPVKKDSEDSYYLNTKGDTIRTRVPLKIKPQIIPCKFPKMTLAGKPILKETATFEFHTYGIEQGLNSTNFDDLLLDKQGNLWISGWRSGLTRFDGKNSWHFTDESGFPGIGFVRSSVEDQLGNIWLASITGGLARFDGYQFQIYNEKQGLGATNIRALHADTKGNIWIGTWGGGIIKFDGNAFTHWSINDGITSEIVRNITEDNQGNIWFSCYAKGLIKYDGINFIQYTEDSGLPKSKVNGLSPRKEGGIWVVTYKGLSSINGSEITNYTFEEDSKCKGLVGVYEAKNGTLYLTPYCGGLVCIKNDQTSYYQEIHGIGEDKIEAITEDESGQIWLGTQGSGLIRFNPYGYSYLTKNEGLVKSNIRSITKLSDGKIALTSWNNGFSVYDGKTFTNFLLPGSTAENVISQMFEDSQKRLWFVTQSPGAFCLKNGNLFRYTKDQGLSSNNIHKILEANNGDILFCTHQGGLSVYNGKTFTRYSEEEGLPSSVIFDLVQDKNGIIWIATNEGGLTRFDGKTFQVFSEKEGLPCNSINNMLIKPNGDLWMAFTNNGLGLLRKNQLILFSQKCGLISNEINTINSENDSTLWFGSSQGLSSIITSQKDDKTSYQLQHFNSEDGIRWLSINAGFIENNQAWWATDKGVMKGAINHVAKEKNLPKLSLTQLLINDQLLNFSNNADSTSQAFEIDSVLAFNNIPLGLKLPYQENNLNFSYSAIAWGASHKIRFSYKLEGIDNAWSTPSMDNSVVYKNLPHGKYVLKASVAGIDSIWTEPINYSFEILPPWWKTWWAYVLYTLIALGLLRVFVNQRERSLIERKAELEEMVDDRTIQLSKEKKQVELKNREILDSIEYAKRIQATILPPARIVKEYLQDSFILYLPKDIVAGDFYWIEAPRDSSTIYFAACDSTGHGVPGAMVSVVCHNALNKALNEFGKRTPASILDVTADLVIDNFSKNSEGLDEIQDGMDASLCSLDFKTRKLMWAGANCPLILLKANGTLEEIKADKQPVGRTDRRHPFTNHEIQLDKGDSIYLITDGFADQFGGANNKKFQRRRVRELLLSMRDIPMLEQRKTMFDSFDLWKGSNEQVDDITVIGVKV